MYRHPYHFAIRLLICQGPSRFFQQVQLETISENLAQVFDLLLAKIPDITFLDQETGEDGSAKNLTFYFM